MLVPSGENNEATSRQGEKGDAGREKREISLNNLLDNK